MGLSYYIRVLNNLSVKRIWTSIKTVQEKSGKAKILTALDMIFCAARYGAGHSDYLLFEYYNMTAKERKTFLSRLKNKKLTESLNDVNYGHYFDKKSEFAVKFSKYTGRDILNFKTAAYDDFLTFIKDKDSFLVKPDDGECGAGIEKLYKADFENEQKIYQYIKSKGFGVCEQIIEQHPVLSMLHEDSLNCVRVTTLRIDNEVHVLYGILKMGSGGGFVDNLDRGGLACHLDLEKGEVISFGHTGDYRCLKTHPSSKVELLGYKIPYCKEIVDMVKEAALVVPQVRYIGWDVAVTPSGAVIVEGNNYPGYDFPQLPDPNMPRIGLIPKFKSLGINVNS